MTDLGMGSAIVPSILAKRYDISISGINDDPDLEKQVDVIDYMFDATTIMTQKGNPLKIADMASLCGKKVAGYRLARSRKRWWKPPRPSAPPAPSPS